MYWLKRVSGGMCVIFANQTAQTYDAGRKTGPSCIARLGVSGARATCLCLEAWWVRRLVIADGAHESALRCPWQRSGSGLILGVGGKQNVGLVGSIDTV